LRWQLVSEHPFGADNLVRHFRLPSGLQLVLAVDRTAPVISLQVWYGVGSRHETRGRTGMAHLFEHLMFNQTENLGPGEIDRLIEQAGGDTNAATWVDWTYYRTSLPAVELELAARLEAERMLRLTLDDDQLEAEREVVINERLQRVDDDVDGFLDEQLMKLAFTQHPYHWPTIGWMDDIRAIAKPEVHAFYRTFYAPNNATLVLVGDVDEAEALAVLLRHFGAAPPSQLPADAVAAEPVQTAERRKQFVKPVPADRVLVGYRAPAQREADWPVLDLIDSLLIGGPSSRLYKRLVFETHIASSVEGGVLPLRDPSLWVLSCAMTRGHRADEALAELDAAIARLIDEPVANDELDKVKNGAETEFWTPLATCDGKGEALGHFHLTTGDYRRLFTAVEELRRVTAADVQRVARAYLRPEHRTVVVATPGGDA
jgi:zinc protease